MNLRNGKLNASPGLNGKMFQIDNTDVEYEQQPVGQFLVKIFFDHKIVDFFF